MLARFSTILITNIHHVLYILITFKAVGGDDDDADFREDMGDDHHPNNAGYLTDFNFSGNSFYEKVSFSFCRILINYFNVRVQYVQRMNDM